MSDTVNTFVFADLAGFTALTEAHGDERAADIALEFCASINQLLPPDADDLKMLGDACLLRVGAAEDAVELGLDLASGLAERHGFPDVRVGMDTGAAARRGSDWFGATLNVAARVGALAGAGEVLLTESTWEAAGAPPGASFDDLGERELRNLSAPVRLYRARREAARASGEHWVTDPVCRMRLDLRRAATSIVHDGHELHFCSLSCAARFSESPDPYLRARPGAEA